MIFDKLLRLLGMVMLAFGATFFVIWQVPLIKGLFQGLFWLLAPLHNFNPEIDWIVGNMEVWVPASIFFIIMGMGQWPMMKRLKVGIIAAVAIGLVMWGIGF